ncbi:hypothetical protein [Mesorhizobium erdmanii]|uniref:hypothetical protein n=1 Tax=Mesorhizobium erdmanii TaxID=1777866 RepID=UPI0012B55223|nr:hypothetical protein [Mesorhizobium erdmanii]
MPLNLLAKLAGISRQAIWKACLRGNWRGHSLEVRVIQGKGGNAGNQCDVRNYLAFHGVYQSGIMGRLWVAYAIENRSVFWLRVGVSDPKIGFTNGLNDS